MFLTNMLHNIYDIFLGIFKRADENSRKRTANTELIDESELLNSSKRFRPNDTRFEKDIFIDITQDENDEIEILSEYHHSSPLSSFNKMNNSRVNKRHSLPAIEKTSSYRNPESRLSYSSNSNNLNMGCLNGRNLSNHNIVANPRQSTLSTTLRLQEKRQYGELLQNFFPQRIHFNKPQRSNVSSPIEVIDLDKTDESQLSQQSIPIQRRQFYTPWLKERTVLSNSRVRSNSQSRISRIQIDDEDELVQKSSVRENKPDTGSSMPLKALTTNTLREALASKTVLKKDFSEQIAKRHEERLKQQRREAEEVKRQVNILSDKNRLTREIKLEDVLARTLKLCEAVIDDRIEPEEEPLPTLTEEMLSEVRNALAPRSTNDILIENFGLRITRKDIQTLSGLNWLNDEVINFYMNLLIDRGNGDKYPRVHAMNTFFYPKLLSGGHSSLKRWTRKIDIFAQEIVVVPIHLGIHWCMSIIDFREKSIRYFDSMGSANPKCLVTLRKYLEDESFDKKKEKYDTSDWKLESVKDIPQQMNGSDCGVFSCMFAEFICANRRITFNQEHMPYFRNKMVYEILNSKLL